MALYGRPRTQIIAQNNPSDKIKVNRTIFHFQEAKQLVLPSKFRGNIQLTEYLSFFGTLRLFWWGRTTRAFKPLPYFRYVICPYLILGLPYPIYPRQYLDLFLAFV